MKNGQPILWLMALVGLVGCTHPTPRVSDGRKIIESRIQRESEGLIRLRSFVKTNGIPQQFMGRNLYEMQYTVEIEFLQDCMWTGVGPFGWEGHFSATPGFPRNSLDSLMFFGKQQGRKGQRQTLAGKLIFQNTEQGWQEAQ